MPVNSAVLIPRDGLMQTIDGLSEERLIYISAPAGFGKTVALRQWLDKRRHAKVTLTLDDYDNHYMRFCERFCAALHACQPRNAALADIVSHHAFSSAPDEFALRAIAALSGKKRAVFAIDDLHFISDEYVLRLLLTFIKRLPATFQIVLVSRNELPPGFSDLWLNGRLARVSAEQFRFSSGEIALLYKRRGSPLTPQQADDVCQYTGGWAIGVNALLLSGSQPSGESLEYLEEFILSNVWNKWDEEARAFMLSTALARELHPSLCDALSGVPNSADVLLSLMRAGAFITQTRDGVYHYHHLFQGFLRHMLDKRGEAYAHSLLEKEGYWHLNRKDFYSAAECFIRCGHHEGIAQCFDVLEVADRNDFVIERMLPITNHPEVRAAAEKHPSLCLMLSWCALAEGRADDMNDFMDRYYTCHPEIARRDPNHTHKIFFLYLLDARAPMSALARHVAALPIVAESDGAKASLTMNMPFVHRCTRDFSEFASEYTESVVEGMRGVIGWLFGKEVDLLAESLMAGLLYEQGQLERAHIHALAANAHIEASFAPESKFCAMAVLICVLDALGQYDESKQVLARMNAVIEQDRAYYLIRNSGALAVRRELAKGDMKAAEQWLAARRPNMYDNVSLHGVFDAFTTCRAHITAGEYDSAIILATKLHELAKAFNRPLDIIEARILLAIAFWKKKRGFQEEAMRFLEDAVSMAYGYGYTQQFVNEGAELAGMTLRLQRRMEQRGGGVPVSFIKMLCIKMQEGHGGGLTSGQPEQPVAYTEKQKTVMRLLCEGKRYREIALAMGIKLPTLRSHIALIYKKLDVTNETEAVRKIRSQGIIDDAPSV